MTQTLNESASNAVNDDSITDEVVVDTIDTFDTDAVEKEGFDPEQWVEAIKTVSSHYRLEYSLESLRIAAAWGKDSAPIEVISNLARHAGLSCTPGKVEKEQFSSWRLPVVVQFNDGHVAVVETQSSDGRLGLVHSGDDGLKNTMDCAELLREINSVVLLRPSRAIPDSRIDDYVKPYEPSWFRKIVLRDMRPYGHVLLASLLANVLALAGILFTRQVYDRVIPAESMATLYVLFSGVVLALVFEFVLRGMRVRITDLLGKRADLRISDRVFGHSLRIRNEDMPRSTGAFVAQLRELEQVREMMTSSTVIAFADMPFFFLFCFVLWHISGPLVLVPLCAIVLLIVPGMLVQSKLKGLAGEALRESAMRNAILVETVQGMEDIKALQAEQRFQQQWNHCNAVTADVNLKLRSIAANLSIWGQNVQSGVFSCMVLFGAPMVMNSTLSVGALVASSILASRMMASMSQLSSLMSRWQQARLAMQSINQLMERRVENEGSSKRIHRGVITGSYQLRQAVFQYPETQTAVLQVAALEIQAGEKIAVLGRNGAGKSTLLQALSGSLEPKSGEITLDDINLHHLDMADVRRDVVMMSQNARMFHGTIRENLMLGAPRASDDDLRLALIRTGAWEFVRRLPGGLDFMLMEGGTGMSGGQRQSLLLARLLLRNPNVLLLDEPTAAFDEASEKQLIEQLSNWVGDKTLVLATHRMSMLSLVDRIIVIENGRISMDDTKSKVLSQLAKRSVKAVRVAG